MKPFTIIDGLYYNFVIYFSEKFSVNLPELDLAVYRRDYNNYGHNLVSFLSTNDSTFRSAVHCGNCFVSV